DADGRALHAGPGDLLRLPAKLMHNQVSDGYISTVYLGFSSAARQREDAEVLHLSDVTFVRECMLMLARVYMHQASAGIDAAEALLAAVLREVHHQTRAI